MKQSFLFGLLFLFLINLSTAQVNRISRDSIDPNLERKVYAFAFNTFSACENGSLPKLTSEHATETFKSKYNSQNVSSFNCKEINEVYGQLIKINLVEIVKDGTRLIFRYMPKYEKIDRKTEIRVYVNQKNKFIGIISKPYWFKKLYDWKQNAPFIKVNVDTINKKYIESTFDFANSTYECQNNYLELSEKIATKRLTKSLTDFKIAKSCNESYNELGKLVELNLAEVLTDNETRIVYRYKSKYSKSNDVFEILVVSNMENKFDGIFRRKWFDKFYEWNETPAVKRIELDALKKEDIQRTTDFVFSSFNCDKYKFMNLDEEIASKELILFLTDEELLKNCGQREKEIGKLVDFNLIEVLTDEGNRILYRFKSRFTKSEKLYEILVTCDLNNRFIGIFRRNWFDEFYELYQEPKENKK